MTKSTGAVREELRDGVLLITLDRPSKANALTIDMSRRYAARLATAATDAQVSAVVVTGAGERAFSGGVDLRDEGGYPPGEAREKRSAAFFDALYATLEFPKPLVAALNGVASGGAAMIALLADRILAASNAALSLPEIEHGGPTFPGLAIVEFAAGAWLATDLVQTGRRMPATEAQQRGLFAEVLAHSELAARAQTDARALAAKPQRAYALNKQWLRKPLGERLRQAHADMVAVRAGRQN